MIDAFKFGLVREILFKDWDPIDVNGNAKLIDEYDYFVPDIIGLLDANVSLDNLPVA